MLIRIDLVGKQNILFRLTIRMKELQSDEIKQLTHCFIFLFLYLLLQKLRNNQ